MKELKAHIHEDGTVYNQVWDCHFHGEELPEEPRHIGKWGHLYLSYLEENDPLKLDELIQSGLYFTVLCDLNRHSQNRFQTIVRQMAEAEGVNEDLKRRSQWDWIRAMNSILDRTEEIVRDELCNG